MAQVVIRANLAATSFPLLSELSGRSIILKQQDQNYVPQVTSKEDVDKDVGVPQLYYCHNIMATAQGYQAVDYLQLTAPVGGGVVDFTDVISVFEGGTGNKAYIAYTAAGNFYYGLDPFTTWVSLGHIVGSEGKNVTVGYINGITYIYVANVGCYQFNFSTNALTPITLTGLTPANILGIFACQGYLIAYAKDAVAWSSLIIPTDFVPSLATGAGGGAVQNAKGDIVACLSHTIGFVVYTSQNAVAAVASGNARFPFNFRELVNSGGLASDNLVAYDANSGNHYAYTTSGVQSVSLQQTQTVFPEVTDFLAGAAFEDFDETTHELTTTYLASTMQKRFAQVSDRYLVISYGSGSFTHALIYDIALKRWGKVKVPHVQCFEYSLLVPEVVETPRRSMAFLQNDGTVKVVRLDLDNVTANGVLLLGKFQYMRQRVTQLQTVDLENIPAAAVNTYVEAKYTLDGKTLAPAPATLLKLSGLYRKYGFNSVGVNHSILVQGSFHLVSVVVALNIHGRR